jgi:hypothetical protein
MALSTNLHERASRCLPGQQAERISAWFVEMHKESHGEDPQDEDSPRETWLPPELRGRAADVELLNN